MMLSDFVDAACGSNNAVLDDIVGVDVDNLESLCCNTALLLETDFVPLVVQDDPDNPEMPGTFNVVTVVFEPVISQHRHKRT